MKAYGYAGFVSQHFPLEIAALKPHAALTVRYTTLRIFVFIVLYCYPNMFMFSYSVLTARDEFVDVVSTFTFVGAVRALHVLPQESPTSLKEPLGIKARMLSPKKTFALLDNSLENREQKMSFPDHPLGAVIDVKTSLWTKITDMIILGTYIRSWKADNRQQWERRSRS
ncbi:nitrate ABC transporter ATPases C and D [Striga asiatica]|uniref:Nitrate ABC transporter ATPases C and D n=1 Tax=Striga asiatica TaxID=4170 RepID=A0A5A7QCT0_STRAF|nr:nitrate ABC transporter ATPases C and D [Striga asiatica]